MICPCCGKPRRPSGLDGMGTALKPAMELIAVARKPLSEKTIAANVLAWGTGAINVDGCRVEAEASAKFHRPVNHTGLHEGWDRPWKHDPDALARERIKRDEIERKARSLGRWPANIIHDGSEEVLAAFPETGASSDRPRNNGAFKSPAKGYEYAHTTHGHADTGGSAARFFYSAKADGDDRIGSKHPTVKPVDLMRYLVRLVTPLGGLVLDPFAGTGTTGEAAFYEGFRAVLIEREAEYQADIALRMKLAMAGPEERVREAAKARHIGKPIDAGPLFSMEGSR